MNTRYRRRNDRTAKYACNRADVTGEPRRIGGLHPLLLERGEGLGEEPSSHPHQKETISQGYVVFGCGNAETIPPSALGREGRGEVVRSSLNSQLSTHNLRLSRPVRIVGDKARLTIHTKAGHQPLDVTRHFLK